MDSILRPDDAMPAAGDLAPLEDRLMFRRSTVRTVSLLAVAAGLALDLWRLLLTDVAFLTPINPTFHAVMIGIGVFAGVPLAVVVRESWLLGLGARRRPPPRGLSAGLSMIAIVGLCGFGGHFLAGRMWDWWAFGGIRPAVIDHGFEVVHRASFRGGRSVTIEDPSAGTTTEIACSHAIYDALQVGDRIILPVEIGRAGAERVRLPAADRIRRS